MNKRSLIIQNIGTIIFFIVLNVFMIFMFLYAFEVLPASASEALPSSNGGNYVISNGDLVQFDNGTIDISGNKVRPYSFGLGYLLPSRYNYYKLVNGSMVPFSAFDLGLDFSSIVSGRYKVSDFVQTEFLIHVSDAYLTDASLTRNITLIPTSNYALYVRYNDTVCMLESTSPFNINYVDGLNYIVSNTGVIRYEWHDGWQQASSSASAYTTNFIYRVIGDFYTRSDFSIFAFAFKGELASGEVPEATPSPIPTQSPDNQINNYFDYIRLNLGQQVAFKWANVEESIFIVGRSTGSLSGSGSFSLSSGYAFNLSDFSLAYVATGSNYTSPNKILYFSWTRTDRDFGIRFDSSNMANWPFIGGDVPGVTVTPSPIPTFVPTATPVPTVGPAVSVTPEALLSPFPTGPLVTSPPWADDIRDAFSNVDLDAGSSWGLWGYAFSFIPSQLRNLLWVFVAGLLIVAFFWLIGG